MDLPGEIRNHIYDKLLVGQRNCSIPIKVCSPWGGSSVEMVPEAESTNILLVNRQISNEARHILYSRPRRILLPGPHMVIGGKANESVLQTTLERLEIILSYAKDCHGTEIIRFEICWFSGYRVDDGLPLVPINIAGFLFDKFFLQIKLSSLCRALLPLPRIRDVEIGWSINGDMLAPVKVLSSWPFGEFAQWQSHLHWGSSERYQRLVELIRPFGSAEAHTARA